MASFAGLRGTGDWGTDERPKNFREYILWRRPNGSAPLTALMARMKKEKTNDPEFSWWEEELNIIRVLSATGLSATSTTLTIASGGLSLVKGDVLLVEKTETATYDNEHVMVSSVTSDTVIEVIRGVAGTTAAITGTNVYFTHIGSAYGEGTNSPDVTSRNPTKLLNYCQIFKTAYEETETANETYARTGPVKKNDKIRRSFDHSRSLETRWMFGVPFETTGANGKPLRFTGGLRHFITTNVKIYTTTPTEDVFLDDVYKIFDYDAGNAGTERLVFAGNGALNALNKMARLSSSTRVNFNGSIKAYGMELQRWILPQGTLYVRTHPLMNQHARYTNSMFIIDPSGIRYRPLRDTRPQEKIQANDADTEKGQWLTEAGLEVNHEKTMGYLGNFTVP
jgi:hypothetical protein